MHALNFILFSVVLPIILSVVYSKKPAKQERNYILTKSVWYLCYAFIISANYLSGIESSAITGLAVCLAIFEGLPPILTALFETKRI